MVKTEEKEIEKQDEIDKETLQMPSIQDETASISLEISHNRIIFLDKPIKRREKTHKNWKYSYWKDYRSNLEVEILDRDYWKSAELMRLVMETKKKKIWLLILWIFFAFILVFVIIIIIANTLGAKTTTPTTTPIITPITQTTAPISQINPTPWRNIDIKTNTGTIVDENKNKNDLTNNQMLALEYQAQEAALQINLLMKKNEFLQSELNEKTLIITQKDELINKKALEIDELTAKLKNLTANDFILYLGNKIASECEKNQNNYCKELYFNYIKK